MTKTQFDNDLRAYGEISMRHGRMQTAAALRLLADREPPESPHRASLLLAANAADAVCVNFDAEASDLLDVDLDRCARSAGRDYWTEVISARRKAGTLQSWLDQRTPAEAKP